LGACPSSFWVMVGSKGFPPSPKILLFPRPGAGFLHACFYIRHPFAFGASLQAWSRNFSPVSIVRKL
jgi:G:T-mismatch repair DNA endonuclease (very short patch repair protein)